MEKPAAWVGRDARCLATALTAQRSPNKRPREDALLKAERSHQRRRIELLEEQLHAADLDVRDLRRVKSLRLFAPRPRAHSGQSLPCAGLRLVSHGALGGAMTTRSPQPDAEKLIGEWQAELSAVETREHQKGRWQPGVSLWPPLAGLHLQPPRFGS